jgi:hypothetical protein
MRTSEHHNLNLESGLLFTETYCVKSHIRCFAITVL